MSVTERHTDLTGLSTDEAIAFVQERMTREWAGELVHTRARMVRDGLSGEQIETLIEHEWRAFERERDQHLDELRAALLALEKKLH